MVGIADKLVNLSMHKLTVDTKTKEEDATPSLQVIQTNTPNKSKTTLKICTIEAAKIQGDLHTICMSCTTTANAATPLAHHNMIGYFSKTAAALAES